MIDLNDTDLGEKDYFHNGVKNTRIKTVSLKFASYLNGDSLTKAALMCPNMETLDMYSSRVTEACIASAFEVCYHIRNLDFCGCSLIRHIRIGAELPNLRALREINLKRCHQVSASSYSAFVFITEASFSSQL